MTKQYDNEKRIVVFPNDKEGNAKRPDFRGSLQLNGREWRVSLWRRDGQRGEFWSGTLEEPKPKSSPAPQQQSAPAPYQPQRTETEDAPF